MNSIAHLILGGLTLGFCAWGSNIWPGTENWKRAALSRFIWWGLPFGAIATEQGAALDHAAYLGMAAWLGAWIPHTDAMPDIRNHWTTLVGDVGVAVLRATALLALPATVFWVCGAFWVVMIWAVWSIVPAVLIANHCRFGWPGLRTRRQAAGVIFGIAVGMCVAAAIEIDVPMPDYLETAP